MSIKAEVKNKERFAVSRGGHSFAGHEAKTVEFRTPQRFREADICKYLDVQIIEGEAQVLTPAQRVKRFAQNLRETEQKVEFEPSEIPEEEFSTKEDDEKPSEAEATEAAEKLAKRLKVDLAKVEGSGAEGRVTKSDVETFAQEK